MNTGRSGALAFMAGLGNGYLQQEQTKRDQAAQDAQLAWQKQLQARQEGEWSRQDQQRAAVATAAAPVAPTSVNQRPDTADDIDVGTDPTAAPVQQFVAGGKNYPTMGQAQDAAAAANTPQAQMTRIAAAIRPFDPAQAATLESQATQSQMAGLQLSAAQRADIRDKYNQRLLDLKSPQDFADFVTNTKGDGQGGAMKAAAVTNPDGSFTINTVDDSGKVLKPLGTFKTADDARMALMQLSPEQQLIHLHQTHQDAVAQQQADTMAQWRKDEAKNQADKVAMMETIQELKNEARGAGKDPLAKMTDADKRTYSAATQEAERLQGLIDKASVDGTFGNVDPSTKQITYTPQQQDMLDRVKKARAQAAGIASRYDKPSGAGPLGAYDPSSGAPAPTTRAPAKAPVTVAPISGDTSGQFGAPDRSGVPLMGAGTTDGGRIPDPPPQTTQQGLTMVANPAYAAWVKQYGTGYAQQQAAEKAANDAAALDAFYKMHPTLKRPS